MVAVFFFESPYSRPRSPNSPFLRQTHTRRSGNPYFYDPKIRDLAGPYFSYIEQDIETMGIKAVHLLLKAIQDPTTLEQILISITIHSGRTT